VPPNTTATVFVPATQLEDLRGSGRAAANAAGVKFLRGANGRAICEVGAGRYEFESRLGYR